jgi:hypothetical protein
MIKWQSFKDLVVYEVATSYCQYPKLLRIKVFGFQTQLLCYIVDKSNENTRRGVYLKFGYSLTEKRGINPRGVKLQALTRSLAYQAIIKRKEKSLEDRLSTEKNLELTRRAVEEVSGSQPTEEKIWKHTHDKTLLP